MRWMISDFALEDAGQLARTFQFELVAGGSESGNESLRGDGLLMTGGRVRFNREQQLRGFAREIGAEEQRFLSELGQAILRQAGSYSDELGTAQGSAAVA